MRAEEPQISKELLWTNLILDMIVVSAVTVGYVIETLCRVLLGSKSILFVMNTRIFTVITGNNKNYFLGWGAGVGRICRQL